MNVGDLGCRGTHRMWGGNVGWEQLLMPAQRALADLPPMPTSCTQDISESLVKPPSPDRSVPGVTVKSLSFLGNPWKGLE